MTEIEIRSQALRRRNPALQAGIPGTLLAMTDDADAGGRLPAGGRRGGWRQSDVRRAIAAAEQAGLESYRVEIAPDGTIAIIVGDPADTADDR